MSTNSVKNSLENCYTIKKYIEQRSVIFFPIIMIDANKRCEILPRKYLGNKLILGGSNSVLGRRGHQTLQLFPCTGMDVIIKKYVIYSGQLPYLASLDPSEVIRTCLRIDAETKLRAPEAEQTKMS